MAPKRARVIEDPPAPASSSDGEVEESSSEEEEEVEEEEENPSEEEEEIEEEKIPTPIPTPTPTKEITAGKKSRSKPSAATPTKPSASAARSPKRSKKKSDDNNEAPIAAIANGDGDDKKPLFQRLWSEDDEIAILKGIIDFMAKNGTDPIVEMGAFHDFVKKSIHFEDFTKVQLADKVRRLRKKFENLAKKKHEPSKPNEKKAYELSKRIWAGDGSKPKLLNGTPSRSSAPKANGKDSPAVPVEISSQLPVSSDVTGYDSELLSQYMGMGQNMVSECSVKRGIKRIPEDKKAELVAKWRKIQLKEIELFSRRAQLLSEQSKLIHDALASDN